MSKVFVIGLDGATFELIEPWVEEGKLPTFKKLMDEGSWGPLKSTLPPLTVPAWATMFTGKNPGKLGLFGLASRKKEDYSIGGPPLSWDDIYPVWEILERSNSNSTVISVPTTSVPEKDFGGTFVAGTGPMIGKGSEDKIAIPASLDQRLKDNDYRLHLRPSNASRKSPQGKRQYLEDLEELTESRFELGTRLMADKDWDLFVFSLFHTDMTQHIFWRDYLEGGEFKDSILDYYREIDTKLGRLLEKAPEDSNVIVVSDHGHTELKKEIDLNRFLVNRGCMEMESEEKSKVTKRGIAELLNNLGLKEAYKKIRELPGVRALDNRLRDSVPLDELSSEDVNWSRTRAYSYSLAGVYLNVAGREPRGVIDKGEEYEAVREDIINVLQGLQDPETGEKVARGVFKKEEVYSGPYMEEAPDILIDYLDPYQDSHSEPAPQHESVFNEPSSFFTSTHTRDGIFIASGSDIKPGGKLKDDQVDIQDVTPLILHLLGLEIPGDADGRVPTEIFTEDSEASSRKPEFFEPPENVTSEKELTDKENEEVKERLEDLGYL